MSEPELPANESHDSVARELASVDSPPVGDAAVADAYVFDPVAFRNRTRWFLVGALAMVLALVGGIGAFIRTDYVALMPGSARDTEPLLVVEGTESFPSDGELLFTTVRLRQNPNVWEYLWLKYDDDVEIVPQEAVLGDRTTDENREVNLQAMVDSKSVATAVALRELGYDTIQPIGVLVSHVIEGEAADGILNAGDIIREVDGVELVMATELVTELGSKSPGDAVRLTVESTEGDIDVRSVVLGAKEADPDAAFLGVGPQTLIDFVDIDLGFNVEIDSGSVGGPSAGLAFTLAILDQLTPGELTGGASVAVTGTMRVDGSVGPVGGVPQKAAAVRDLGIKYFLVPSSLGDELIEELRVVVDGEAEIIPVDDLAQALEVLDGLGGDVSVISEYAAAIPTAE